jgi:hypothetical protein
LFRGILGIGDDRRHVKLREHLARMRPWRCAISRESESPGESAASCRRAESAHQSCGRYNSNKSGQAAQKE